MLSQPYSGFTLITATPTRTDLLSLNNTIVKSWEHTRSGGFSVYLLENGNILRPAVSSGSPINGGGAGGILQMYSWNGNLIWEFTYSSNTVRSHHDICQLPNGNVLMLAWEVKSSSEAVSAGLNHSAEIWPDHIIEVQQSGPFSGNIVWEWHFWDHLIQDYDSTKANYGNVASHHELLDINVGSEGSGDWMHCNGISYNENFDQILISSYYLDEIFVIDHSTTTAEASGHSGGIYGKGGDFLYRWGKPSNYRAEGHQYFDVAHNSVWIPDSIAGRGNILVFNNGQNILVSSIIEIIPPVDSNGFYTFIPGTSFGPDSPCWIYSAVGFYTDIMGGCQRLPNGNTLIAESRDGYLFEINKEGFIQWSFAPRILTSRVLRYGFDYQGLSELVFNIILSVIPEGYYDSFNNVLNSQDSVKVFVRNSVSPYNSIDSSVNVISLNNFKGNFYFGNTNEDEYYIEIKHRNTINVWSAQPVRFIDGQSFVIDISNSSNLIYGNNLKQVDSNPVRYALFSGDVNKDNVIDGVDLLMIDNDVTEFNTGYQSTDLTGDLIIDALDASIAENNASDFISVISP